MPGVERFNMQSLYAPVMLQVYKLSVPCPSTTGAPGSHPAVAVRVQEEAGGQVINLCGVSGSGRVVHLGGAPLPYQRCQWPPPSALAHAQTMLNRRSHMSLLADARTLQAGTCTNAVYLPGLHQHLVTPHTSHSGSLPACLPLLSAPPGTRSTWTMTTPCCQIS
jgi:hypothetical protein